MLETDQDNTVKRRIAELPAGGHLLFIQTSEIVAQYVLQNRMRRFIGLDHHLALLAFAARPSSHLRHQLEASFVGSEIGERQHIIGVQDAHYLHCIEIQPFGDHLCTHQDIRLLFLEILKD